MCIYIYMYDVCMCVCVCEVTSMYKHQALITPHSKHVQAQLMENPLSIESLSHVPAEDASGQETYRDRDLDSVFVCIAEGEVYYQM